MTSVMQLGFDYETLTPEVRSDVRESARRIHELERRTSESILEIGNELIRVKARLPHGEFLPWLDSEFGWSQRAAYNFIKCAEVFGDAKVANFASFQPSALNALASNNVPDEIREDFMQIAEAGMKVTHADVRQAIDEYKAGETMNIRDFAKQEGITLVAGESVDADTGEILEDDEPEQSLPAPTPQPETRAPMPHVSHNSGENEWYTPSVYLDAAREVMGGIDLDPASSPIANERVQATEYFTKEMNGLAREWHGRVWMNPPYAQPLISNFCEKVVDEFDGGKLTAAIVLVNNATETRWFQNMARVATAICFTSGRIKYLDSTGTPAGAPLQGQAFLYFGDDAHTFAAMFRKFGFVMEAM